MRSVFAVFLGLSMMFALWTPIHGFSFDLPEEQMENTTLVEVWGSFV